MQQLSESKIITTINENVEAFLTKSTVRLKSILERLNWTEENVLKRYNTNQLSYLKLTTAAVADSNKDENPELLLPESFPSKNTVIIAQNELCKLVDDPTAQIPKKFSDMLVNFSPEQRLLIYEYVVERTGTCTEAEIELPSLKEGQMTFADIVAMKRREKKKRKYRTSKPTHIEEVRGLVELQMQAFQQYLETKEREARPQIIKKSRMRSHSREHNYRSYRVKHTYVRRRSRDRDTYIRKRSRSRSHSRNRTKHKKRSHSRCSSKSRKTYKHHHHHREEISSRYKTKHHSRRSKSTDKETKTKNKTKNSRRSKSIDRKQIKRENDSNSYENSHTDYDSSRKIFKRERSYSA